MLPQGRKKLVLELAHDELFAGHLGASKTYQKLHTHFFWPGMRADVKDSVDSVQCVRSQERGGRILKRLV